MTDHVPGATPVKDQRPQPKGVLPKNAQAWLMAALAIGIVAVIVLTGRTTPPVPTSNLQPVPSPAADADRLREYQARLRMLDEQARRQSEAPSPAPTDSVLPSNAQQQPTGDPMMAEKRRLEYESLFSRVVVRGGQSEALRGITDTRIDRGGGSVEMPTLDAITEAVMRATQGRTGEPAQEASAPLTTPQGAAAAPDGPPYRLQEGTIIPAVLTNRLDGSSAAPVNCMVNSPVYALDRQHVLIPTGARLLGRTTPVQAFGETRLAVSFHRLVMPDGRSHTLEQFVGLNQRGDAGLRDQVNQHYRSTFGAAAAIGLLSGLSQALGTAGLTSGGGDRTVVVAGAASESAQVTGRVLDRFLNRPPTITIREGHPVHVYVTSDLQLPAYESTDLVR
jgi:type IV secretion system protein TrbI